MFAFCKIQYKPMPIKLDAMLLPYSVYHYNKTIYFIHYINFINNIINEPNFMLNISNIMSTSH